MANGHEKDDALDVIRTGVQLHLRQYKRRVQTAAENEYERLEKVHALGQGKEPFDHIGAATAALGAATKEWLGIESPLEQKSLGR